MKNTVIFDMDGVIVDTEPLHKKAYYQHFEELKITKSKKQAKIKLLTWVCLRAAVQRNAIT